MARLISLISVIALSGCQGDGADGGNGDWADPFPEERAACVDRINGFRATLDLPPYERWRDAEQCSDGQAADDARTGRAHGAFGDCGEMAQNECPGWDSMDEIIEGCLQTMWDEGPGEDFNAHGHFLNMSSTDYSRVACGFHVTSDGAVWAVQNFR